jgi:hypothetical protein
MAQAPAARSWRTKEMKKEELIMALQDECLVDRTKVEDFLQALADICVAEECFRFLCGLPALGALFPRRLAIFFLADDA